MDGEKIDPSEVAYHRSVVLAGQRQQAVSEHWMAHLSQRYRLGPGDFVDLDGAIIRATKAGKDQ